jgi:hypothetical protein
MRLPLKPLNSEFATIVAPLFMLNFIVEIARIILSSVSRVKRVCDWLCCLFHKSRFVHGATAASTALREASPDTAVLLDLFDDYGDVKLKGIWEWMSMPEKWIC